MHIKVILLDELLWAMRAGKRLHSGMHHVMLVQVSLLRERGAAENAFIWFFLSVNSHVVEDMDETVQDFAAWFR